MENTNPRIPKSRSGIKPPSKIQVPLGSRGMLRPVSENKIAKTASGSTASQKPSSSVNPIPVKPNNLKRRSKSATDLRPTTKTDVSNDKVKSFKVGQKRQVTKQVCDEIKPKSQKLKIPDWDYKSRFSDLQKRHDLLIEDLKNSKIQLLRKKDMEKEIESFRKDNIKKGFEVSSLQVHKEILLKENQILLKENCKLNDDLTQLNDSHESLKVQFADVKNKYKENLNKFLDLEKNYSTVKNDHKQLQKSYEIMERKFERITEEHRTNLNKFNALETAHTEVRSEFEELNIKYKSQVSEMETLKQIIEEHETLRQRLHNTVQDLKGNIRVFCRVRPPLNAELDKQMCSIQFPNESCLEIKKMRKSTNTWSGRPGDLKQEFTFNKVFPPEATQSEVFEELCDLVQSALDGYQVCVFAYGQTGSGKTFTMQGSPHDHGMIPRTIDAIFDKIEKLKLTGWNYKITTSFLEIYNENIRDLLEPNSSHNYEVRYEGRGVTVSNLKVIPITQPSQMKKIMEEAHKNRAVAATDFNLQSSRSHAVTKIHLKGYNETSKITYKGSINLVDLAGSESAKTSAAKRLTETKNINKSLSTLGNVMLALDNKDPHVPYRNSKLTFLLQSCLGGNSKTLMFVNISPFEECYGETINSLRFATKVKDVKTQARKIKGYIPELSQPSESTF